MNTRARVTPPKNPRGRPALPEDQKRIVKALSVDRETDSGLAELSEAWEMSQGRVVDELVARALKRLAVH